MKKVAVFLAPGFEEIEALTTVDVLRRAGVEVVTAAVGGDGRQVQGAHGIPVIADVLVDALQADDLELTVCPGGMPGATNLAASPKVLALIRALNASGRPVAAICAAPLVLHAAGVLDGRKYTCYPGFERQIGGAHQDVRVVTDANVTTGVGPGASLEFALELLRVLGKGELAPQLASGMIAR